MAEDGGRTKVEVTKLGAAVTGAAAGTLEAELDIMQAAEAAASAERSTTSVRVNVAHPLDATSVVPILRAKLTTEHLAQLFGTAVAYLRDVSNGDVVWPAKWITDCVGPPVVYWAVEKAASVVVVDALAEDEYRGDTKLIIMNVPATVSEAALRVWFQTGLDDEFPELVGAKAGVAQLRVHITTINHRIEQLPSLVVRI